MTPTPAPPLTPLFVLGVPRSGTTMMGQYLETSDAVVHLGEYAGLYVSFKLVPQFAVASKLSGKPITAHMERYLEELRRHALEFPQSVANGTARYWCDSSPVNLMVVDQLVAHLPEARYILMVRHYRGVLPSLSRCFERGEHWAGATWEQRARLWRQYYFRAATLPRERVIPLSYDQLCQEPRATIEAWKSRLDAIGIPAASLNDRALATSWATTPEEGRPTIATVTTDGTPQLPEKTAEPAPREVQASPWSAEDEQRIAFITAPARAFLATAYPEMVGLV